jgi:hypothetical protein
MSTDHFSVGAIDAMDVDLLDGLPFECLENKALIYTIQTIEASISAPGAVKAKVTRTAKDRS